MVTLVMVCNNHLVIMLSALLKSIEVCNLKDQLIEIYIVDDGISKKNRGKINQTLSSKKISIVWKSIKEAIPKGFKLPLDNSIFPLNAYVRLFLQHFLPKKCTKAIYLDVDMIVLNDISRLWEIDIGQNTIAAAIDGIQYVNDPFHGIINYNDLGISPETKYFNSGLLIINLDKWKQDNCTTSIINIIIENKDFVTYPDQYGLNVFFANNWYELDTRWNNFAYKSNDDPFLIHFISIKPLFKGYNFNCEYKNIFYEMIKSTPWTNYSPRNDYVWKVQQFRNKVSKYTWLTITKKSIKFIYRRLLFSRTISIVLGKNKKVTFFS